MSENTTTTTSSNVDPIQSLTPSWVDAGSLRFYSYSDLESSSVERLRKIEKKQPSTSTTQEVALESDFASTSLNVDYSELSRLVESLLHFDPEVPFEDGISSVFSRTLIEVLGYYGIDALVELFRLIITNTINDEIIAETLRWLGQLRTSSTHRFRLAILIHCLTHESSRVRDGAILGLCFLNDADAIPDIRKAFENEKIPELKEDILEALTQLRG